jgi:hypothetical protein
MNPNNRFIIQFDNKYDYRRLHWWLLLLLVTVGSSLLWAAFMYALLVIPILITLYLELQKAFKIQLILDGQSLQITKRLLGIPYFQVKQPYSKIIWQEQELRLIFVANKATHTDLQISMRALGMELRSGKTRFFLCGIKTAPHLIEKLLAAPSQLQLTNFYHFRESSETGADTYFYYCFFQV